jgi:predicted Zn finger-like uncharacterized protein
MIVSCPNCSTRYTLSESSVGANGRKVKCAKCGHIWWQRAVEDDLFAADLSDAPTEIRPSVPMGRGGKGGKSGGKATGKKASARPDKRTIIGLIVLAVVVAAMGGGAYVARDAVVRFWPPAALLYETLGLMVEAPGAGLQLQNVRSEQKVEGGTTSLIVQGQIVNVSDVERMVPRLRAVSLGADHKPLQSWLMDPSAERLQPGDVATFRHSQPDPGPVTEVTITLDGG